MRKEKRSKERKERSRKEKLFVCLFVCLFLSFILSFLLCFYIYLFFPLLLCSSFLPFHLLFLYFFFLSFLHSFSPTFWPVDMDLTLGSDTWRNLKYDNVHIKWQSSIKWEMCSIICCSIDVLHPQVPFSLRLQSNLMLGIMRVYKEQVYYFCSKIQDN